MREKLKKQHKSFFADFKKFITKGNVIDMAVGVVIGTAFSAIVNGLVKMIINPVIALLTGGVSLDEWKTVLKEAEIEGEVITKPEVAILWGEWMQTIINFFIVAFCIFVAVRIISRFTSRLRARELAELAAKEAKKRDEDAAKAAALSAENEKREAALQAFYQNVERQTKLLEEIAKK